MGHGKACAGRPAKRHELYESIIERGGGEVGYYCNVLGIWGNITCMSSFLCIKGFYYISTLQPFPKYRSFSKWIVPFHLSHPSEERMYADVCGCMYMSNNLKLLEIGPLRFKSKGDLNNTFPSEKVTFNKDDLFSWKGDL